MSSEMGLITGSILLFFVLNLTNANLAPTIPEQRPHVCEDTPLGKPAFNILATDPEKDPLTYAISGSDASYFKVEPSNGTVYVEKILDRELNALLILTVTVRDTFNNEATGSIYVLIDDANDNTPIFDVASYEKQIPENTPVGTTLFDVVATDADGSDAGTITYSIDEVIPNAHPSPFSIGSTTGRVILEGKLNYTSLSTFYRLKIIASDKGGKCYYNETVIQSRPVFAFITVEDIPDLDPQFIGIPYLARVEEHTSLGKSVLRVTAVDQDTGINDKILYSIQDATVDGLFAIAQDGVISVSGNIDQEVVGDIVVLTVKATEENVNIHGVQASATAQVQITIIDLNDNMPEFFKCGDSGDCVEASSFTGEVKEHYLGAIFINMTVKDKDKNSQTELSLNGTDKDVFSVEPHVAFSDSVVQLTVKQPDDLDFEKNQQMSLTVVAVDRENRTFRSTANVTINIIDINDHSPKFEQNTYFVNVSEHCPDGTRVITIKAEDPDSMDKDKLTYTLLPNSILPYFDVEPTTGVVYVKNGSLLDREVRSLYSVTLQARDTDNRTGSTVLEITVTDINDKPPVPNRDQYQERVPEGKNLNVQIEATDGDEPGSPNSQLVFGIMPGPYSGNFTIDPDTGVLTNKGPLDREAIDPKLNGRIELNVTITDKGTPPLSTVVKVIINVEDVNDNVPKFDKASYNFTVKEGEKGAFVGSVHAVDLDQATEFNRISFSIINGAFGSFIIRSFLDAPGYSGNITVDPDIELDYESSRKHFSLQVEASDLEQEKAQVTVEVYVLDVNDERPEFKPIGPVSVEENSNDTEPIGKFMAVDKDGNHSLVYKLESVQCRCNGTFEPCNWFVVEPNGDVKIKPDATLDYESCNQAIVEAQVEDEYTEKGEANSASTGEMVINIVDVNDNAPEFIYSNSAFIVVSETASKGTSVAGVSATDKDTGAHSVIEFKVTQVQFKNTNDVTTTMTLLFEAITTLQKDIYVGIIQSTEGLDTKLKGKYLVTVEARDTGGLINSTVLEIFIVDESNRVQLRFSAPTSQIEAQQANIIRDLSAATQAAVQVVSVKPEGTQPSRESEVTIMLAYFVYHNGSALPSSTVEKVLSLPENYLTLSKYGLIYVGTVDQKGQETDPVLYILLGMVGGLIIVTAALTTSLLCSRRNYKRKLRAANAMKSASVGMSENQRGGAVVPGTNQYTMEGANPVLNLNIDTSIALDLDGESSDVDRVSLNSLDNSDDMTMCEKDTKPIMKRILEEEEDDDNNPAVYIEPLGAALAQRGQKISSNNPLMGDTNPIFSTTDL